MSRRPLGISSKNVEVILTVLKVVGFIAVAAIAPQAILLFKPARQTRFDQLALRRTAYYLKRRGDIKFTERGGQRYVSLTTQGSKRLDRLERYQVRVPEKIKWDGKWRVVIFDIPEKDHKLRDTFRSKLRELGCLLLQGSVWISPYEIRPELKRLCAVGGFAAVSIQCLLVQTFDDEKSFRKKFRLS